MRAGDMRRRLTIQVRGTTQDTFNQQVTTWTDVATVWADIQTLTGKELLAAAATQTQLTHIVRIRYQAQFANPKVMAAMRCMYGTRIFNISASIDVDEQHRIIELLCQEGPSNG